MRYVMQVEHAIAATLIVVLVLVTSRYILGQCNQEPRVVEVPAVCPIEPLPELPKPQVDVTVTPTPIVVQVEPERCRPMIRTLRWVFCPRCR